MNKNNELNILKCDLCGLQFSHKSSMYRHKNNFCNKKKDIDDIKKELEDTKIELVNTKLELSDVTKELNQLKAKLMQTMETEIKYLHETHKNSAHTLDKSMDALTFLMTHRKNAPELKKLTHKNAQELLTNEAKLYTHLLYHNDENTLDQYIGEIILAHIKKENPDDQSVWNSDVSRLTYLIREIVDESLTWLRDPNGAMFDQKIIVPIINVIRSYLDKCLYSKNPDNVELNTTTDDDSESDNDSVNSETEHEKMRRNGRILGTIATLKSKKYKKLLSEYIASRIPLHKSDSKNTKKTTRNNGDQKSKKIVKNKTSESSDSDTDQKPKKIIKKKIK